jgi:hypothetical protein
MVYIFFVLPGWMEKIVAKCQSLETTQDSRRKDAHMN